MNGDPIIAHVLFTDGARRAVYLEATGKQYDVSTIWNDVLEFVVTF